MKIITLSFIMALFSCVSNNNKADVISTIENTQNITNEDIQNELFEINRVNYDKLLHQNQNDSSRSKNQKIQISDKGLFFNNQLILKNELNSESSYQKYDYEGYMLSSKINIITLNLYESSITLIADSLFNDIQRVFDKIYGNKVSNYFIAISDNLEISNYQNGLQIWENKQNRLIKIKEIELEEKPIEVHWISSNSFILKTNKKYYRYNIGTYNTNLATIYPSLTSNSETLKVMEWGYGVNHIFCKKEGCNLVELIKPKLNNNEKEILNSVTVTIVKGEKQNLIFIMGENEDSGEPNFSGLYNFSGELLFFRYSVRKNIQETNVLYEYGNIDQVLNNYHINDFDSQINSNTSLDIDTW